MNALELVRRQLKREQALKEAQKATATNTLLPRQLLRQADCFLINLPKLVPTNCYIKQTAS